MMQIGILSDTHNLLRPQVLTALRGAELILHAGDVCREEILRQLRRVAPVYAVRGNNDRGWAKPLPPFLELELEGVRLCMAHRKQDLSDLSGYDLAVVGHSHRYAETQVGRTLLLNPGSCGPRRFHQAITLARAELSEGRVTVTRIELAHTPPREPPEHLRAQIELVLRESERGAAHRRLRRALAWMTR